MTKSRPAKGFIILILGSLMSVSPFAIDMYLPAFPQIASDFNSTPARISLSVASYFLGLALGQLMYGPLLDRYGRKGPLYAGLMLFMISSLGCMQSHSVEALVIFRFTQALGGCVAWVGAMAMVRDFFPVEESSKVFSLLILVLGLSPLLAPTAGGFITVAWGWPWVFAALIAIALLVFSLVYFFLPDGRDPDPQVSLRLKPMFETFVTIYKDPQFYTYTIAGGLSFATLFIYVSGSPVIFMEIFHVDPPTYGMIFAVLSIGFIGGSQLNILLTRHFSSEVLFRTALISQVIIGITFLISALNGAGMEMTMVMLFLSLACIGIINPNASSLALSLLDRNLGSASALIGCTQIVIASVVSTAVGFITAPVMTPFVGMMVGTSLLALLVLRLGLKMQKELPAGQKPNANREGSFSTPH